MRNALYLQYLLFIDREALRLGHKPCVLCVFRRGTRRRCAFDQTTDRLAQKGLRRSPRTGSEIGDSGC